MNAKHNLLRLRDSRFEKKFASDQNNKTVDITKLFTAVNRTKQQYTMAYKLFIFTITQLIIYICNANAKISFNLDLSSIFVAE